MLVDKPYYIYSHTRPDTNEIFYIGKGNFTTKGHGIRHLEKYGRSKFWKAIVAKNNGIYQSEIICYCETEDEVNAKEIEYIALYGRKNLNKGTLCNLTDGADGSTGIMVTEATKKKLSDMFSGEGHPNYGKKLSEETCQKKSESMKASLNNLRGKKLPEWWKDKIRQTKFGEQNPMFGKIGELSHRSRKIINTDTKEVFNSVTEAAEFNGMKMKTLYNMLSGHRPNKTNLIFA